ncbi:hypothetical protein [Mucilaginibacter sp. L196]|uniref:hypothetical protein n=1 Tax=Mucilaginibacter sp. L196 TaxID=1641870 RepID=UPI00131ACD28|nr:hypothetical protein [Mucilaginibacter sp. L196]
MDLTPYSRSDGFIALEKATVANGFMGKFVVDSELTDTHKTNFLDHLQVFDISGILKIEDYCCGFFRQNKYLGKSATDPSKPFVRILPYEKFVEWINKITLLNLEALIETVFDSGIDESLRIFAFEQLINADIKPSILSDPDECIKFFSVPKLPLSVAPELKEALTSQWGMWSFPFPEDESDIFAPSKLNSLDCRAGLTEGINLDKVVYTHSVQECNKVKKPTVYDAEFYDQFMPGGKTVPLAACNTLDGFDEYFHVPNKFKHILDKFALIIK